jgi:FkbM family methyltransferase
MEVTWQTDLAAISVNFAPDRRLPISTASEAVRVLRANGNRLSARAFSVLARYGSKRPVPVRIKGERLYLRPSTPDWIVAQGTFDGELNPAIRAATPIRHGLIVDAGGYIGTSAIALARAFPDTLIVSLEPARDNFEMLYRNTRRFRNIVALNQALAPRAGVRTMVDRNEAEWGYAALSDPDDEPSARPLYDVGCTTIPALLTRFNKGGIDLLKLDIEGGEFDLFAECPAWIEQTRAIVVELHDRFIPGCTDAFERATAHGRWTEACGSEKLLSVQAA